MSVAFFAISKIQHYNGYGAVAALSMPMLEDEGWKCGSVSQASTETHEQNLAVDQLESGEVE